MHRKWFVLFSGLILLSLILAPVGLADAQSSTPPRVSSSTTSEPPVPGNQNGGPDGAQRAADGHWFVPASAQGLVSAQTASASSAGGPDNFGYTWDDSLALNWIDTSGGTDTGLTGDSSGNATSSITLPFSFKYYENTYNQIYIAASGYLGFTDYGDWPAQERIPSTSEPNNIIAPYWSPTTIGAGSWVHYMTSGSAPDRYFAVEWHDVSGESSNNSSEKDSYRFETILYENGDIVFQYQTMTGNYYCGSGGIEDSTGQDGLAYVGFCQQAPSNTAVRFFRPAPAARVQIVPLFQGRFSSSSALESFQVPIYNTGEFGPDVYDLTSISNWPVFFYAADGTTPLTDTDSDGKVDTGSVAQGSSVSIKIKIQTPDGASVGRANRAVITARSSLNTGVSKAITLDTAVPAPFAQVYDDYADSSMSIDLVQPNTQLVKKVTEDNYYGYDMAVTETPNGTFVYAWEKYTNIVYTLLDHFGNTVRALSNLTDNHGGEISTDDYLPSIAVAPDGHIGVLWTHYLYDYSTSHFNYNIYFSTLDSAGNLLSGPTNITNNTIWSTSSDLNIPEFYNPTIAATSDNHFILSWQKWISNPTYAENVWYAVGDTAGSSILAPKALTTNNSSWSPTLNSLTGGKTILTWESGGFPAYAVLDSSGGISKAASILGINTVNDSPDAVQLSNGKVAVAWPTQTGVQFTILNSSYGIESGPTSGDSPSLTPGYNLSVTTDLKSHVIMTWADGATNQNLFYALGDSVGAFTTTPMAYKHSDSGVDTSYNGQGNTTYSPLRIFLPLTIR